MSLADEAGSKPGTPWGLAGKLIAILILLGAISVLITGGLGYVRARDALEQAIYNQLTAVRETKERQVETYFATIASELRLLAMSKMVTEAAREFSTAYAELDRTEVSQSIRRDVDTWYMSQFIPSVRAVLPAQTEAAEYLPAGSAAYYLQYHYIVGNPQLASNRKALDQAGDGSAYSKAHAVYHPLLRAAAATVGFFDMMLADPKSGRIVYGVEKEVDLGTSLHSGPYRRSSIASAVARCGSMPDPSVICLEDFIPYIPSGGAPTAFMAAPVIDRGLVIGVLVAQLSIERIDTAVTSGRHWRQEGLGLTGETYLVGPDEKVRSGPRAFYENREAYYADLQATGTPAEEIDAIRRYGTPVLHQRANTQATRNALAGIDGTGEVIGYRGVPTLASWGPAVIPGLRWGLVAKIDSAEAFAPIAKLQRDLVIVGALALLVVVAAGMWLSRSLLGPLRELTDGVHRFALGDYDAKVAVRTRDEIGELCAAFNRMVGELRDKTTVIQRKNQENEELLLNVLPAPIALRLRGGEQSIADSFAEVTVAFADIVGFTALSSEMSPHRVLDLLNGLFSRFDAAAEELGVEKIKTIGDAYMAVCGLNIPAANHAERMVRLAVRMIHITREHAMEHNVLMQLRIGINSGPVAAGVIGRTKYIYDLWGDTVNLASRMEASAIPDVIQVTRSVHDRVEKLFTFEARGTIEVKGKGPVEAWLLRL